MNRGRLGQCAFRVKKVWQIGGGKRGGRVDDEQGVWRKRRLEPGQGAGFKLRVTSIERANPHGKSEVEFLLAGLQDKILDRHTAKFEAAGRQFRCGAGTSHGDCFSGSVDGEHHALLHLSADKARGDAGTAADFEDPHIGPDRQGGDSLGDAG